jgi:hypothetical protein
MAIPLASILVPDLLRPHALTACTFGRASASARGRYRDAAGGVGTAMVATGAVIGAVTAASFLTHRVDR